jgi:hypothetical protein
MYSLKNINKNAMEIIKLSKMDKRKQYIIYIVSVACN